MADATKLACAQKVFATLCEALDDRGWNYERKEDDFIVQFGVQSDDLPVHFVLIVDADRQLLRLASPMTFTIGEDKRTEGAIITNVATMGLRDGNFDYDVLTGHIVFRMTAAFHDSVLGKGLMDYFIDCTNVVVDHYNDRFAAVNNGEMTLQEFLELEQE